MIFFLPDKVHEPAADGEMLLQVSARANILINNSCGTGKCGKCKVQIINGPVPNANEADLLTLTSDELENSYRLACRMKVSGNMTILVPQESIATDRKTKLIWWPASISATNHIEKKMIELKPKSSSHTISDVHRIFEALGNNGYTIQPHILPILPTLLNKKSNVYTATLRLGDLIDFEEGDTTDHCFGIAFDIGTTTVVGMLWDMMTGASVGIEAETNPQSHFGADIISRIDYARQSTVQLQEMQHKIIACINNVIDSLLRNHNIEVRHLYEMTVAGNTAMSHLFLGINPEQLASSPYTPVFCHAQNIKANDLGIAANPSAMVHLLPNIAGHVGSDLTAGILATGINLKEGLHLLIDIGTNGEILLSKDGKMSVCSTAAGPAFEGAAIHNGLRAVPGAIESVVINGDTVAFKTIQDEAPRGICGSGLIDLVAEMIRIGVIEASGKLLNKKEALAKGISSKLSDRLQKTKQGKVFVVAERQGLDDIVITQKDLRQAQLAKAAIHSGIMLIMDKTGSQLRNLKTITIAGAFGNYVNKESAMTIGLIPEVDAGQIINAGNSAGIGASIALLSLEERKKAGILANEVHHVELAAIPSFQKTYIKSLHFDHRQWIGSRGGKNGS